MFHCNEDLKIKIVEKQSDMTPIQYAFFMKGYPIYQEEIKKQMEDEKEGKRVSKGLSNKAKGIGR